ncbi:hypothetical protein, partial [Salmonella enterica]|uniref:hypothetical protein n=1 Tax=Salmonella enterica TaxID=28901 RepID=UPI000C11B85C
KEGEGRREGGRERGRGEGEKRKGRRGEEVNQTDSVGREERYGPIALDGSTQFDVERYSVLYRRLCVIVEGKGRGRRRREGKKKEKKKRKKEGGKKGYPLRLDYWMLGSVSG